MNSRRYFFRQLASGLVAAAAPGLFLPKLIKPGWKVRPQPDSITDPQTGLTLRYQPLNFSAYEMRRQPWLNASILSKIAIDCYGISLGKTSRDT